MTIENK